MYFYKNDSLFSTDKVQDKYYMIAFWGKNCKGPCYSNWMKIFFFFYIYRFKC